MENMKETKSDIRKELAKSSLVGSVRLPKYMEFELNNDDLHLHMTEKGLVSNMQDDCAAFEGWAILLKFWLPKFINNVYIHFTPINVNDGTVEAMHYQRFLYRLSRFIATYSWARCTDDSVAAYSTLGFVLNTPGSESDVEKATHKEAQFERELVKTKPSNLCITNHQLPVGVFKNKVEGATQIMNSGAIDLWGIDKDVLNIYELKIDVNKKVGIITELLFYVNIMNDLMKHRINYEKKQYKNIRSFEEIYNAYDKRSISRIIGVFLTPTLHPLFTGGSRCSLEKASVLLRLLDFMNDSERLNSEHIKFTYQYQKQP